MMAEQPVLAKGPIIGPPKDNAQALGFAIERCVWHVRNELTPVFERFAASMAELADKVSPESS